MPRTFRTLLAAANAVATSKDDRYIIAQLRLKAAYAANDDVALAGAIDAVAASGFIDNPTTMADLYVALGSKLYNGKKYDLAASRIRTCIDAEPDQHPGIDQPCGIALLAGPPARCRGAVPEGDPAENRRGSKA